MAPPDCLQPGLERLGMLSDVSHRLWLAGSHWGHIRPLHRQLVLGRQIIVSEDISLHLITQNGKTIFVKPFPKELLQSDRSLAELAASDVVCRGFIWTYMSMIQSETDFRIALQNHLLPALLCPDGLEPYSMNKRQWDEAFQTWVHSKETWETKMPSTATKSSYYSG
jgi:hypothetical protein